MRLLTIKPELDDEIRRLAQIAILVILFNSPIVDYLLTFLGPKLLSNSNIGNVGLILELFIQTSNKTLDKAGQRFKHHTQHSRPHDMRNSVGVEEKKSYQLIPYSNYTHTILHVLRS